MRPTDSQSLHQSRFLHSALYVQCHVSIQWEQNGTQPSWVVFILKLGFLNLWLQFWMYRCLQLHSLCLGMQSIVILVSKSAFCGAYKSCMWHALWSQSSNSGITGDIRLPSNSGVILHWWHCCDLSIESKTMYRSSLVRFFKIEESYFWSVKPSHMQKFPGLLLSVIKVVALFDLMFCRLKLHRLETLNWTVHGSHLSSSSPQACCSLNEDTLDYVSWVPSYIMTAYYCHFQKCDRNSRQILYHAVLKILSRFLYSIYWSSATVGRWSSQWIVICIMMKVMVMTVLIVTLPSDYCCGDFLQFCRYAHSVLNHSDSVQTDCKHELLGSKMDLHHRSRNTVKISSSSITSGPTLSTG
jgi:hypothetical protein